MSKCSDTISRKSMRVKPELMIVYRRKRLAFVIYWLTILHKISSVFCFTLYSPSNRFRWWKGEIWVAWMVTNTNGMILGRNSRLSWREVLAVKASCFEQHSVQMVLLHLSLPKFVWKFRIIKMFLVSSCCPSWASMTVKFTWSSTITSELAKAILPNDD